MPSVATVVDLLEYHGLLPCSLTPVPIPLVRRVMVVRVRPAPIVSMTEGTTVTVQSEPDTVGVSRNDVTYWRAATWT
jgi:hypothetical protein